MERRKLLTMLVHGGSATIAGVVGIPTIIFAISPAKRASASGWRELGPIEEFPLGEVTPAIIQQPKRQPNSGEPRMTVQSGVYVWHISKQQIVVFSRSCTDLGCPVTFDRGSECFLCPCHGGIFSKEGERMAGPPDRPLYRYETRLVEGVLQVNINSVPPMV